MSDENRYRFAIEDRESNEGWVGVYLSLSDFRLLDEALEQLQSDPTHTAERQTRIQEIRNVLSWKIA
jgi:PHD/YefM family antitoxin component YafN of YafNO toxin-antitoxin module